MRIAEALRSGANKISVVLFLSVTTVGVCFSALIPPFQSPDEFDHIKRAYLFMKGRILLESPAGQASGGKIDTGLLSYINGVNQICSSPQARLSVEEELNLSALRWTGSRVFSSAPATGYYFPLVYTPQAAGLLVGKKLKLTVDESYRLARFFTMTVSIAVIAVAFSIFPTNVFVLGLLILPMSIFQLVSASIDGFTIALSVLCASLFMRGCMGAYSFPRWMSYSFTVCILILTTSRMYLLPLLILPVFLWMARRERVLLFHSAFLLIFSLGWLLLAIASTHDPRPDSHFSAMQLIRTYLKHPGLVAGLLLNTIADPVHTEFYRNTLIGVLGWLDTHFTDSFYRLVSILLILLAIFSISINEVRAEWRQRIVLVFVSGLACLLVFVALLIAWNPSPTRYIEGVQGRYFITPLLILGYAFSGSTPLFEGRWKKAGALPLVVLAGFVVFTMPTVLLERYFMNTMETHNIYGLQPSIDLHRDVPIKILMTDANQKEQVGIRRIGIMFATYSRHNSGDVELRLNGPGGVGFKRAFSLSDLADNKYHFFDLDSRRYLTGEIASISGEGISTWESRSADGSTKTCLIYEYSDGRKHLTPGCPIF